MRRAVTVAVGLTALLGAFSTAANASSPDHHKVTYASGADYLRWVAPYNKAIDAFSTKEKSWTSATTGTQAESDAKPLIGATQTFDAKLTKARWPKKAVADIHVLVVDDGVVAGDLRGLAMVHLLNGSVRMSTFERDYGASGSAAGLVRRDLGLPPVGASQGHVGDTLDLTGASASVTLTAIADPAAPAQYITPDANTRFVGATITITNTGDLALDGNANSDSTLTGSDGQIYTPVFQSLGTCTNFDYGNFNLGPSESVTGCVAFQVPNGVAVTKFKFAPDAGYGSSYGEWAVP